MVDYVAGLQDPNASFMRARSYAEQLDQLANRRGAGTLYAMGNRQGAAQALASGGDIQGAQAIEQGEATRFQAQHEYIRRALPYFQAAYQQRGPQGLSEAYAMLKPDLTGPLGMGEDEYARFAAQLQANPERALQMLQTIGGKELQAVESNGMVYVIDKTTGNIINQFGSPKPQMHVIPAGGRLAMTVPGSDTATMPAQTPVPIAPSSPQPSGVTPSPPQGAGTPAQPSTGVPVPQPQPTPPRPQPQAIVRPPVATSPQGAAPGRGLPPPDAVALGLPNPEVNPQAFGPRTQIVAEGAPKPEVGALTPRDAQRITMQLRNQFNNLPDVKAFNDVAIAYDTLRRYSQPPYTAANDMAMVFTFMKSLDPTSTVREGEYANAQNAAGVPDRVQNWYNHVLSGQILTKQQRADFADAAYRAYQSRRSRYDELVREYQGYAANEGIEGGRVITPRPAASPVSRPRDPFPGIAQGQRVRQGGKTYVRRGDQMVEVQ